MRTVSVLPTPAPPSFTKGSTITVPPTTRVRGIFGAKSFWATEAFEAVVIYVWPDQDPYRNKAGNLKYATPACAEIHYNRKLYQVRVSDLL